MNGVTFPVMMSTMTMRELLFCPPPCVAWLESVAKSRPPWNPFSNAMSTAGPAVWRPTPGALGFAKGLPSCFPF
jgi:hypothetical protein